MTPRTEIGRIPLEEGATVAVIGGGPAGSFVAIHLLREAARLGRKLSVVIFERRRCASVRLDTASEWRGCNYCAGGISPKLNDVLRELELGVPEEVIQRRIHSITIQGFWKNIELEVPAGREMYSVYRGSRPEGRLEIWKSFDSFLLDQALKAGAGLIGGEVTEVSRAENGKPVVCYRVEGVENKMPADLAVFAAGVNESLGGAIESGRMLRCLKDLIPGFAPPVVRHALVFELGGTPRLPASLTEGIHFVEYGSRALLIEMCSVVPKHSYLTVTLVGPSVDVASHAGDAGQVVRKFLELPHIRKLLPAGVSLHPACACRPNMVVGSARRPFGDRVAAIGDMATARLYKDGILSAHQTARALAETVLRKGVDAASLREGYGPTLRQFAANNRVAALVFLWHRIFFSSSVLSRVLYQAVISERKAVPAEKRRLEKILWRIASGDDEYKSIFASMIHPAAVWSVFAAGAVVTLRNYVTELLFGLRWEGFGRFTTGVACERLEEKRRQFSRLIADASVAVPGRLEFERMYTIKINAGRERILDQLGRFGEEDRGYLRPRWVRIRRVAGEPNAPGCVIQYEIVLQRLKFSLVLEQVMGGHLAVYRVRDGFARGGVLIFEIEKLNEEMCALSIYVAFNFPRGRSWAGDLMWSVFRVLFPAFVHDVLWNHSLCQLKDQVEVEAAARSAWRVESRGLQDERRAARVAW